MAGTRQVDPPSPEPWRGTRAPETPDAGDQFQAWIAALSPLFGSPDSVDTSSEGTREELHTAIEELRVAMEHLKVSADDIAQERHRYVELFEAAPEPYIVTDLDCVILEANRSARRMLVTGRSPLAGRPLAAHITDQLGLHRRVAPLRESTERTLSWQSTVKRPDDRPLPVLVRVSPVHDTHGKTIGLRWMLHDLRERLELTRRERAAHEMVAAQATHNEHRLQQLERVKTEILLLASHELRRPLTVAQGYLSMALAGDYGHMDAELERALSVAFLQCRTMSSLIDRMLVAARIAETGMRSSGSVIDMKEVVRAMAAEWEANEEREGRLLLDLPTECAPVRGDPAELARALGELVDNAAKYAPAGTDVGCTVTVDEVHRLVRATVSDEGGGIDRDVQDRLFERFGRVVTRTTSHIPGPGLGLFLAREIARLHGGDLSLTEGEPGERTTLELILPLASAES